jgi:hypothetical protein
MKEKAFRRLLQIGVFALAVSLAAVAQSSTQMRFSGVINDYTPATVSGPWEIRGEWSLQLTGDSGKASFSAVLTMERSDEGVLLNGGGDFVTPAGRHAHTHHVMLDDGTVTPLANGFRVTGTATIAGNGNPPPDFGILSPVQIDIVGGSIVQFSNIKLSFGDPASTHFGTLPFNGVVLNFKQDD